ncbi:hypothetical protein M0R45_019155 [Rubus argutus]|uniref:Uncharacterized protein n=1 Tax=Rubus argutus TaxID=59490 RepID=A0AAW1X713_RUBAR
MIYPVPSAPVLISSFSAALPHSGVFNSRLPSCRRHVLSSLSRAHSVHQAATPIQANSRASTPCRHPNFTIDLAAAASLFVSGSPSQIH